MSSSEQHTHDLVVIPAAVVHTVLDGLGKDGERIVEDVYRRAAQGDLVNPDSLFLRPDPERRERAIALPAYVRGEQDAMGVKWISSFPDNLGRGLPRASALITLNDVRTGFPRAVLEGARISAYRTALSATVGARVLRGGELSVARMAVVGTGYIAGTTLDVMATQGWRCETVAVHDLDRGRARDFAATHARAVAGVTTVADSLPEALSDADLVLFATTATEPYVADPSWFAQGAVVLHMSLRDLRPSAMVDAEHVVDEVSHALRERTSLGLAVEAGMVRPDAVTQIGDHLDGRVRRDRGRTAIYAPFGLGSLDIAVARLVWERAAGVDGVVTVPAFSGEAAR